MTKKKPDFLRDLDTAIMDELTGGGIKGNAAGLVGTLTQIKEIKQLCGLPFCGYMAKLETVRPSGVPDEVTVVFAEDVPYRACSGIEFDVMQEFVEGSRLLLTGKAQTLKDFQSGRLLVYILADFVAVSEKAVEQLHCIARQSLVLTMLRNNSENHTTHLKCAYLYQQNTTQRRKCPKRTPTAQKVGCKAVEWLDELTLIAETTAENRVNKNGFAVKPEESTRTVFCNKKSVGYSEYFKSQQTGKLVEAKYEVHKADYGGEDVVEVNGRRYFVLKTYDTGTDTIELTLTDLRHRNEV